MFLIRTTRAADSAFRSRLDRPRAIAAYRSNLGVSHVLAALGLDGTAAWASVPFNADAMYSYDRP
jgi:hypothetical protein